VAHVVGRSVEATIGRWTTVLWGIVSLIVGLLLLSRPATTAFFLVQVMAVLWLVGGIIDLVSVVLGRAGAHRAWRLVGGIVAIVAGLILLGNPFVGTLLVGLVQFYLIAFAAIVNGFLNIIGRFQGLSGWGRLVLGIVQLAIGVFFLFNPVPGLLAFVPGFGIVLAIGGLITIVAALFLRPPAGSAAQPA
jgi:Short repeat of unknown function (DUF308)